MATSTRETSESLNNSPGSPGNDPDSSWLRRWWTQPCGGREVLRLALPLMVSTMSWTLMNFCDRMFLLWHSKEEMAAAAPSGFLLFTFICLPLGIASYTNTFVAQYEGSGNPSRIGLAVWQAIFLGLIVAPFFLLAIPFADSIFQLGQHSEVIRGFENTYFRWMTLSAGGTVCSAGLTAFFTGRGQNKTVMIVDGAATLLNLVLDYVLIFGYAGFPEMGIAGAAIATSISQWVKAVVYFSLFYRTADRDRLGVRTGMRFDRRLLQRMVWYGGPEGLRMMTEVAMLTGFIIVVGKLGDLPLAATTLAFNINGIGFVPLIGIGIAVSTLVGQQLGDDNVKLAGRTASSALVIALTYTAAMAVLYLGFPDLLLFGHASGAGGVDGQDFKELGEMASGLLRFVAVYCALDAVYIVYLGVVKGAGDTRFVFLVSLFLSPLPVLVSWVGIEYFGWNLNHCWIVLTAWVMLNGMVYWVRYRQGKWRTMRVVEPELL